MDDEEEEVVPLPNVNSAILKKVIQWATYHKDDPPPPEDDENKEKRTDDISSWDADFLKVDQGTLFELILVSLFISKMLLVIWLYYSKPFNCFTFFQASNLNQNNRGILSFYLNDVFSNGVRTIIFDVFYIKIMIYMI